MTTPNNTTTPQGPYTYNSEITSTSPFVEFYSLRNPTTNDVNFPIQKRWINFSTTPPSEWILEAFTNSTGQTLATWKQLSGPGSGTVLGFNVPLGTTPVFPDSSGLVTYTSSSSTVAITGSTNTINWDLPGGYSAIQRLETDDGLFETPTGTPGTITIHGAANITTSQGTAHQVNIAVSGTTDHAVQLGNASGSLSSLALVDNGVLISSVSGVPEWLPNGTPSYILTANSGAPPSWQAAPTTGFSSINMQVFTGAGTYTYTPTTNMSYCWVRMVGGGAAGGGATATAGGQYSVGGGGGGGEYAEGFFSAATIGVSQTVTIGAKGTGVSGTTGGGGGTTSLGSLISAAGGTGGDTAGAASSVTVNGGGASSGGTGGSLRVNGTDGFYGVANSTFTASGRGSDSMFGQGARGVLGAATSGGANAGSYGAGGSGGINAPSQASTTAGGNGTDGVIVILEFIV